MAQFLEIYGGTEVASHHLSEQKCPPPPLFGGNTSFSMLCSLSHHLATLVYIFLEIMFRMTLLNFGQFFWLHHFDAVHQDDFVAGLEYMKAVQVWFCTDRLPVVKRISSGSGYACHAPWPTVGTGDYRDIFTAHITVCSPLGRVS